MDRRNENSRFLYEPLGATDLFVGERLPIFTYIMRGVPCPVTSLGNVRSDGCELTAIMMFLPKIDSRTWAAVLVGLGTLFSSAYAQHTSPSPERAYADAVQLYHQRLYADAMSAFEIYRAQHPNHAQHGQSLYLEAEAALAQNRDDQAIRLFDQFQANYPSHPRAGDAQLSLAQYFLDEGKVAAAEEQLGTIIENPSSRDQAARALYLQGTSERERGNLARAMEYFTRVRSDYPQSEVAPAAYYAIGATHVRLEQYDRAAASFEQLGNQFPNSPFSKNLGTALGEVYYRLDQYQKAASELRSRLSQLQGSQRARAHFLLAESANHLRNGEDAVAQYRRVLNDHPGTPYVAPAKYGLAWHYYRAANNKRAAGAFSRVRTEHSGRLAKKATYYEAVQRAALGDTTRATELYQTVARESPDSRLAPEALFEAGLLRYEQERYGSAAAFFRALVRDHPNAARIGDAYYWLGNAYLVEKSLDRALEAYNKAASYDTASESLIREVRFQKAWAQYEEERYGDAAPGFLSLAESAPETDRGRAALFWAADSRYQQDNHSDAQTLFRRYLDTYPDGDKAAGARYALAWTFFEQNQFEAAAQHFQQFLQDYDGQDRKIPYAQDARLRLADSYFALKQYEDAVEVYRKTEGNATDYSLYQSGEALNYAGRPEEAVRTLRRLVEEYPESTWHPEALHRIATIHFQQQNYSRADSTYRRLLDTYPDHRLAPEAQYGIGDSRYNAGEMEQAVEAYRRVLEKYPTSSSASEAASSLFFALSAAGQDDRAEDIIRSIAKNNPDADLEDRLRFHRAKAAFQSGESNKALSLFQSFVRTTSTTSLLPEAYYYLGLLYADRDEHTAAKNYLSQLVDQFPESEVLPEGALRLGDLHREEEAYEKAADAYRAAAESETISRELRAQARYGESISLLNMGRNEEAKDILNEILDENQAGPLRASAQLGLARIYESEDRVDEATDLYRSVISGSKSEIGAEALYRLGRLLLKQDKPQSALEELNRISSLFAGYPDWVARSLLKQGDAHQRLDQPGQAAQLYDEVIESYPGTPFAETAREKREAL